jgi:hypothetical protein
MMVSSRLHEVLNNALSISKTGLTKGKAMIQKSSRDDLSPFGCRFGSRMLYRISLLMDRPFFFKDPVLTEDAERLRFFRPESHLATAFGANGDEIEHAGEPHAGRFSRFMF